MFEDWRRKVGPENYYAGLLKIITEPREFFYESFRAADNNTTHPVYSLLAEVALGMIVEKAVYEPFTNLEQFVGGHTAPLFNVNRLATVGGEVFLILLICCADEVDPTTVTVSIAFQQALHLGMLVTHQ
jgi:hypothetical protein